MIRHSLLFKQDQSLWTDFQWRVMADVIDVLVKYAFVKGALLLPVHPSLLGQTIPFDVPSVPTSFFPRRRHTSHDEEAYNSAIVSTVMQSVPPDSSASLLRTLAPSASAIPQAPSAQATPLSSSSSLPPPSSISAASSDSIESTSEAPTRGRKGRKLIS
eukprot:GILI01020020.1.p1 GENE.GILI01020020.1~~GILI01020020.1.p1  ORF type:complete len:173 (+),score=31.61 GILI01020020.1:43-519(+)